MKIYGKLQNYNFQVALTFLLHHVGSSSLMQCTVLVKNDPKVKGGLEHLIV